MNDNTKPEAGDAEALRLADVLDGLGWRSVDKELKTAAAALRRLAAENAALRAASAPAVPQDNQLLRALFEVCEATESIEPKNDFERGRVFEAKGIRRGVGAWFQDTFCGRAYMGEPVLARASISQQDRVDAERAFELGWRTAAAWAHRADLIADIGSPTYTEDRDFALAARAGKENKQ